MEVRGEKSHYNGGPPCTQKWVWGATFQSLYGKPWESIKSPTESGEENPYRHAPTHTKRDPLTPHPPSWPVTDVNKWQVESWLHPCSEEGWRRKRARDILWMLDVLTGHRRSHPNCGAWPSLTNRNTLTHTHTHKCVCNLIPPCGHVSVRDSARSRQCACVSTSWPRTMLPWQLAAMWKFAGKGPRVGKVLWRSHQHELSD